MLDGLRHLRLRRGLRPWEQSGPAAVAVIGLLFAVLGGALLPHDHAPNEAGHRCVFCQLDSVSGGIQTVAPASEIATLPATGERVSLEDLFAVGAHVPPAGRLRDPPEA